MAVQDGHVGDGEVPGVGDGVNAQVGHGIPTGAEEHRRDVGDDLVDQSGRQEGGGQRRAAFEEDVLPVAGEERGQRLSRVLGP